MPALDKGAACLQCRKYKLKCDGLKPHCSRCTRLHKGCLYPSGVAKRRWRSVTEVLQARVLELEIVINKLTLSSAYNLGLASEKLFQRSKRLGRMPEPKELFKVVDFPLTVSVISRTEDNEIPRRDARVSHARTSIEDLHAMQRAVMQELCSYNLAEMDELPSSLSLRLIRLFLPYRSHYYFLKDLSSFMASLSLPASHPNSIHPCLLNACYLGACASNGGSLLTPFKPYFLLRTRQFLEHSLTFADRITDFLWASLILAVFYARERRLVECLTVAEGLVRLALACGLEFPGHSVEEDNSAYPVKYLLPPPNDHSESDDRVRLTYSIYVGSQAYTLLCEYPPILSCDEVWPPPILQEVESHEHQEGKQLERSDLHFKVLVSNTFQRTMMFARYVTANNYYGLQDEYVAIETQLRTQQALLPPPRDLHKPPIPPDAPSSSNASIALGHVTLYGIGLILHSSLATYHRESRAKMFECLQGLVDISAHIRDQKYSHLSIVNIFHIMNAVRVIARELRGSKAKENAGLSISHCRSIELLLDFLDDVIKSLPAWVEAPLALKETLEAAANSLSI